MVRTKRPPPDKAHFSARLRERLREALTARSVLLEAPTGYGKTTAIQDGLRAMLPEGAVFIRHLCAEESPRAAWQRFCQTLQKIDPKTGAALQCLDLPDEDSFGEAAARLREMECPAPTWLVLDDFHRLAELLPASAWKAFLEHDAPLLHLTLATRPLAERLMPYEKAGHLRLTPDELCLTEPESGDYFAAAGIRLTADQTQTLHRRAEGWIIALSLHLRHYRENGEFAPASNISDLLRDAVWDALDDASRDILLRLSPFETWTEAQAAALSPCPPATVAALLRHNAFIRLDPDTGLYAPHSTLLEFTREIRKTLPDARQNALLHAAADWCAQHGEITKAIALYYELREFENILALNLSGLQDNRLLDKPGLAYADALRDIAAHCTRDMKIRHPMSMIHLIFEFFGQGGYAEFAALSAEMNELIGLTALPVAEQNRLRGELLLLEAFTHYNSIAEMGTRIQAAARLTGGRPALISPANSWTFGNASVLLIYHRDTGRLDAELADMQTYCPAYVTLTGGHGSGGEALMRAEALLCRGEAEDAEICAHRARHEAGLHGQISLLIGAECLFGRLALLRGDGPTFARALDTLGELADAHPQKSNRMEADMAHAFLMGLLERPQDIAAWLRDGPAAAFPRKLFTQALPYAHLCRARCLLLEGKPEILLGEADAALRLTEALHTPLARLYGHLHIAAAHVLLARALPEKHREAALAALRLALEHALPDRLLLPLAEHHALIAPLLKAQTLPPDALADIQALATRLDAGRKAVSRRLYGDNTPYGLSLREYETAEMAANGLSNQEIAQRLSVTINTVKAHLKSVYRKSGIQSRRELREGLEG